MEEKKLPLIIDCDPGIDDALALLILYKHKHLFDIKLISATAGNCPIDTTTNNVMHFVKNYFPEAKIAKGLESPLLKEKPLSAEDVHGVGGLGNAKVPTYKCNKVKPSLHLMRNILMKSKEKITLLCLGALTNIARLIITYPEIRNKIEKIYSMIGSINGEGNIEPYAEFNAYFDPEAFDIVAKSGIPMVINPLELARGSKVPKTIVEKYTSKNTDHKFVTDLVTGIHEFNDPINIGLYDVHSAVALVNPDLYDFHPCNIEVYTNSEVRGKCILTKNKNGKHMYQTLKNARKTNDYILTELFNL